MTRQWATGIAVLWKPELHKNVFLLTARQGAPRAEVARVFCEASILRARASQQTTALYGIPVAGIDETVGAYSDRPATAF
jgi:hypothetical protein